MPGLKQGKVANDRLTKHLSAYGYAPVPRTPALWKHVTRPTTFTLCVDDFGIQYCAKGDADHLLDALRDMYKISVDWEGSLYIGLTLLWDYIRLTVKVSMPEYIPMVLKRFQHSLANRAQHSPHSWNRPIYGQCPQLADNPTDSPKLPPSGILHVQQVVGCLLYYALAVDCTLIVALGDIASV